MGLKTVDVPRNLKDRDLVPYLQGTRDAMRQVQGIVQEFDVHLLVLPENQNEIRATISSDQNDYAPTGWSSARYVLLDVTTNVIVTGLSASVTQRRKTIIHVGTEEKTLGFYEQSLSSAAANRFITPTPNDVYMLKNWAQDIWYDATSARWRFV